MDTFPSIGTPDWGFGSEPEAKVTKSEFGDGYELRRPAGLNHLKDTWSPQWSSLTPAQADSTYAWLRSRLNWKAFLWTHPTENRQVKVLCTSARVSHEDYGRSTLSATFVEDHNPA